MLTSDDGQQQLSVTYTLGKDYPSTCPGISITSDQMKRETCTKIKDNAITYASKLTSGAMIMDINVWLQQTLSTYGDGSIAETLSDKTEESWLALMHIDHMRARTKYVKIIESWTAELGLTGRLIFCEKVILLVLCGSRQNLKVSIYAEGLCCRVGTCTGT